MTITNRQPSRDGRLASTHPATCACPTSPSAARTTPGTTATAAPTTATTVVGSFRRAARGSCWVGRPLPLPDRVTTASRLSPALRETPATTRATRNPRGSRRTCGRGLRGRAERRVVFPVYILGEDSGLNSGTGAILNAVGKCLSERNQKDISQQHTEYFRVEILNRHPD